MPPVPQRQNATDLPRGINNTTGDSNMLWW